MEEITIDIKDCIKKILLKWRQICIWMIIGAAVLGGAGAARSYLGSREQSGSGEAETEEETEVAEVDLETAAEALTSREIYEVKTAAKLYSSYSEDLQSTMTYNQNSIKMQLDPNSVPTLVVQYYIDSHYQVVYPVIDERDMTSDIINSFSSKLSADSIYESISATLADQPDASYVRELVSIGTTANDILTITVIGRDQEYCETIADILKNAVVEETAALQEILGGFDITLMNEIYYERVSSDLLSSQQSQVSVLNTLRTCINNLVSGMTEDQKTYYYLLLDSMSSEGTYTEETEENEETEALETEFAGQEETEPVQLFNWKYIILGLLAGAFLTVVWYGLKYILSPRLRVSGDMEEVFGMRMLGELSLSGKGHHAPGVIDRWILGLFEDGGKDFSEEERIRMICAGIRIAAQKSGMKRLYVTGACCDGETEQLKALLCEQLAGEIGTITHGKSVVYDPESLEELSNADGVVLVERIDVSTYMDVKKECELCGINHVDIIGSVVLN